MAYPIDNLTQTSSEEEKSKALQDTIVQMQQEGLSVEEATSKAEQMLQARAAPMMATRTKTSYRANGFAGNDNAMGVANSGYASVLNPKLNNFQPQQWP